MFFVLSVRLEFYPELQVYHHWTVLTVRKIIKYY